MIQLYPMWEHHWSKNCPCRPYGHGNYIIHNSKRAGPAWIMYALTVAIDMGYTICPLITLKRYWIIDGPMFLHETNNPEYPVNLIIFPSTDIDLERAMYELIPY